MVKIKEKNKVFLENNKTPILVCGGFIVGCIATKSIIKFDREQLINKTIAYAFHETINWFDNNFPESHCKELFDTYKKLNPEKIITIKY